MSITNSLELCEEFANILRSEDDALTEGNSLEKHATPDAPAVVLMEIEAVLTKDLPVLEKHHLIRSTHIESDRHNQRLPFQHRGRLQSFVVGLLVRGMLIDNEYIAVVTANNEAEIKLTHDAKEPKVRFVEVPPQLRFSGRKLTLFLGIVVLRSTLSIAATIGIYNTTKGVLNYGTSIL